MRFDDMLVTVLSRSRDTANARIGVWRQLVDILAQRESIDTGLEAEALEWLVQWRPDIPDAVRRQAARGLAGRLISPYLVSFFAEDRMDIASPVLLESDLETEEWIDLIPSLRSSARALMRHRTNLDAEVEIALDRFGSADMILEKTVDADFEPEGSLGRSGMAGVQSGALEAKPDNTQIRTLVARIEEFRQSKANSQRSSATVSQLAEFRFEAGPDGVVRWVDGAPRTSLIGQTIAFGADALDFGVDGHAAGAFRRRAPFRDARLEVAGIGPASGSWRISAVPFFTESDGRFGGYRGMARRPRRDEQAGSVYLNEGLFGSSLAPDSLRQLVHELRTPLNAIVGFSEMIERQLLGPVSESYRKRAGAIAIEAARLLLSVEDLDTAARAETQNLSLSPQSVDGQAILTRLHDGYAAQAEARGVALVMRIEDKLPVLDIDAGAADRMVERLLSATVGLAAPSETITVRCAMDHADGRVTVAFSRPALLAGREESELLDPGYSPDGEWPDAPALGLGFALRLVRNIANEGNGRLDIEQHDFILRLPVKDASAFSGERGR